MGVDKTPYNPAKLTPEQRDKLESWTQNKEKIRQLTDIASMVQDLVGLVDDNQSKGSKTSEQMGAILVDIRESLNTLKGKDITIPDYAKPVVEAVGKLEKALGKLDLKPQIKVDAPQVNVAPTPISVDLKGIEKLLKNEVPDAFKQAIKLIPTVDIPEADYSSLTEIMNDISEKLDSIDTATRLKTQFPSTLKVTNPDGSPVASTIDMAYATRIDDSTPNTIYIGKALPDSLPSAEVWQIAKLDTSSGLIKTWAGGTSNFDKEWDERDNLTYS
jgi:hypothetical protein